MSTAFPQFNFAQASFEFKAKTRVIDELIKKPRIEAFIEDVVNVETRLHQSQITSTRDLELELICAGKRASQSENAYSRFLQHVTELCDALYSEESEKVSRRKYHVRDISRIKQLMPDENYDEENTYSHFNQVAGQTISLPDVHDEQENLLLLDRDFESSFEETAEIGKHHDVAVFSRECDEMLHFTHNSQTSLHIESQQSYTLDLPPSNQPQEQEQQPSIPPSITVHPPTPPQIPMFSSAPPSTSVSQYPATTPTSQSSHRCHCGYIPTGEEKWKASNLRRHKRIQHASESKVYVCRWRGCKSSFTRSDNLRCHVREKGHYEGAEGGTGGSGEDDDRRRKRRRIDGDGNVNGGKKSMGLALR